MSSLQINPNLSHCKPCNTFEITLQLHHKWSDCYEVTCCSCHTMWFICTQHTRRFTINNTHKLEQHFESNLHCKSVCESLSDTTNNSVVDFCGGSDSNDLSDSDETNNKKQKIDTIPTTAPDTMLPRATFHGPSKLYFENEMKSSGSGVCGIVGRSFANKISSLNHATVLESQWHIKAAHFCKSLTEKQQHQFSTLLSDAFVNKFSSTRIPRSLADIRCFYTKNKSAVYNNIPCPIVFEYDNHACVSLESVINHTLGHGTECDFLSINDIISYNPGEMLLSHVQEALDMRASVSSRYSHTGIKPYILYLILWSDDFEVNHTRKNRNSTWIKTVTICPPRGYSTSTIHTQAISLGHKGQDHNSVNAYFNKELEDLKQCTLRYVKTKMQYVPIVVEVLAMSADRPERATINSMLNFNGSATRRWRYSSLTEIKKIPSCINCLKKRLRKILLIQSEGVVPRMCLLCCDWEYDNKNPTSHFKPPPNYPTTKNIGGPISPPNRDIIKQHSDDKLRPVVISYSFLILAVRFTVFNYYHHNWKKIEAQTYLRLVGVSSAYMDHILSYTQNARKEDVSEHDLMNNIYIPSMWNSSLRLEQFVETPMHQLFQGIVKSSIVLVTDFFKCNSKWTAFGKYANPILKQIFALHCDFCRTEPFSGGNEYTTGGWLAETYLGYSRIMPILFCQIDQMIDNNIRGYEEIQALVQILNALLSRLMTHDYVCLDDISDHIKMFLSVCHIFETYTYTQQDQVPVWYSKGNFISLMNLPDQIKQFGPVYLHWEGVRERFIQVAKPLMKNMRTSLTYLCIKLQEIHCKSVMRSVLYDANDSELKQYDRLSSLRSFSSYDKLNHDLNNFNCFLGFLHKIDKLQYAIVKSKIGYNIHRILFDDGFGFHKNNQWFAPIATFEEVNFHSIAKEEISSIIKDHILYIPYDTTNLTGINGYAAISKSWLSRKEDGHFSLPIISSYLFSSVVDKM